MLNPIAIIERLYCLRSSDNHGTQLGIDATLIETDEKRLNLQLPALLYHYYHQLGGATAINQSYNQIAPFPLTQQDDYLVVGKTADADAMWAIAIDDLTLHNPMVMASRNYDAVNPLDVHWFAELPLSEFLLAQAIFNGANGGLTHHAQVYDFVGDMIPKDLLLKLASLTEEILELRQEHERYYQAENFGLVILVSLTDNQQPTAFLMGSQDKGLFDKYIHELTLISTPMS